MHLIVDGMNVIGSRPDGWWRDRAGARRLLVRKLGILAGDGAVGDVTVVFDGQPVSGEVDEAAAAGVSAVFAPGGPDAADHAIVHLVEDLVRWPGAEVRVVTSDAVLAHRVRSLSAGVERAGAFRGRFES